MRKTRVHVLIQGSFVTEYLKDASLSTSFNLDSAVERPVAGVAFFGWQGAMRRNSPPIATIRNAARRKMQRAIQVVATHPQGEPGGPLNLFSHQHLDSASKRSTAKSRFKEDTTPRFYSLGRCSENYEL